jgi:hypothetical protein
VTAAKILYMDDQHKYMLNALQKDRSLVQQQTTAIRHSSSKDDKFKGQHYNNDFVAICATSSKV